MNLIHFGTFQASLLIQLFMAESYSVVQQINITDEVIPSLFQNVLEFTIQDPVADGSSEQQNDDDADDNDDAQSSNGYGRPPNRTAGADRDNCPATILPLTALIPNNSPIFTVSESPTLWFYSPYQAGQVEVGELTYVNSNGDRVYRGFFEIPDDPGIISLQVPETSSLELAMEEDYHWFLRLYCDARDGSSYVYVDAPIRRVAEQSDQGIGYDDVTDIATQFTQNPDDGALKDSWQDLAETLDLEEVMQKPLLDCCEVEEQERS